MLVKLKSIGLHGIDTVGVSVEVNVSSYGMPYFDIIGLANRSIAESKHRVKTSIQNSDIKFPQKRITVNLAPADLPKEGAFYDLPIALGVLLASHTLTCNCNKLANVLNDSLFFGELSLDGSLQHIKGAFLLALYAKENGYKNLFVPESCVNEAVAIKAVNVFGVKSLLHLISILKGEQCVTPAIVTATNVTTSCNKTAEFNVLNSLSINDIKGHKVAKRALEIAAAGFHNILMSGPPGVGKTLLARALPSIMPKLAEEEALELTKIYSSVGKIPKGEGFITKRPFRSPHHTITYPAMLGGGNVPFPGEVTLAHRGALFMDEFPYFSAKVLESLRQPMEDGFVNIVRSKNTVTFPSKFILVGAYNPCPCGFFGDKRKKCTCTVARIQQYRHKFSGPIMDRIDLHITVDNISSDELFSDIKPTGDWVEESIEKVLERVENARQVQLTRFKNAALSFFANAEMFGDQAITLCLLNSAACAFLVKACDKLNLSTRGYFKVMKVARTIADLERSKEVFDAHIAEALQMHSRF